MPVQLSPLMLEGYFVREFSFKLKEGLEENLRGVMEPGLHFQNETLFNPDPITINVQAASATHKEDPFRWMTVIEVRTQGNETKHVPYDFYIAIVGYFKVPEGYQPDNLERIIKVNSASILMGAAREVIASVTGRGPLPAVILPSLIFTPDDEEPEQQRKQLQLPSAEEGRQDKKKTAKKAAKKRASKQGTK
jgi:preprotein translocase subunit SecB